MNNKATILNTKVTIVSIVVGAIGIPLTVIGIFLTVSSINYNGAGSSLSGSDVQSVTVTGAGSSVVSVISNNSVHTVSTSSGSTNTVIANAENRTAPFSAPFEIKKPSGLDANSLFIGGAGNSIEIRKGDRHTRFRGAEVVGAGLDQVIYIEQGRNISVYVQGSGHDLLVDSRVLPTLTILDSSVGSDVLEL